MWNFTEKLSFFLALPFTAAAGITAAEENAQDNPETGQSGSALDDADDATDAQAAPTPYGGQAVIEGVMMKGKAFASVAIRTGQGEIEVYDRPLKSSFPRIITEAPVIRGFFLLWDMLGLGMWALNLSADRFAVTHLGEEPTKKNKILDWLIIAFSFAFAIFIFKAAPTWAVGGLGKIGFLGTLGNDAGGTGALIFKNIIEGFIRLSIFVLYIVLVSRLAEIRRVFEYHGAEHTVINAHEADSKNHSLDFIRGFDTLHPRCGTSFIVIMVVLMIILMSLVDAAIVSAFYPGLSWPPLWLRLVTRIAVVPLLSGLSYEIIKHAFKYRSVAVVDWFLRFGMAFQRLTTRKPDRGQLECGLASLMRVRVVEEGISASDFSFETKVHFMGEQIKEEHGIERVDEPSDDEKSGGEVAAKDSAREVIAGEKNVEQA